MNVRGNETLVKTSTGIWSVTYNGENRPIRWERGDTVITMDFDRLGRRTFYRETENGQQVTFTRFLYDGYVMIQQVFSNSPYNIYKEFIWDPTESVATKPLCFRQYGQADAYLMHDGNKNVTDVIAASTAATQLAHYDYAPFGAVRAQTGSRASANPYRFSSEFADDTLGLVYYNYRHYETMTGRWLGRDPIEDEYTFSLYGFVNNNPLDRYDCWGGRIGGVLSGSGRVIKIGVKIIKKHFGDVESGVEDVLDLYDDTISDMTRRGMAQCKSGRKIGKCPSCCIIFYRTLTNDNQVFAIKSVTVENNTCERSMKKSRLIEGGTRIVYGEFYVENY